LEVKAMEELFVYGTLREPEVQKDVIGRIIEGVPDSLEGYIKDKIQIEGETYPILVYDPHSEEPIDGLVLSITSEELEKIDEYETKAYQREKVTLKSGKKVWVYKSKIQKLGLSAITLNRFPGINIFKGFSCRDHLMF